MDYRYEAPPILRDYLIYHETIKGHSRATVDEYFLDLRNFFRFLKIERGLVPRAAELSEVSILDVDLDFVSRVTLAEVYDYLAFLSRDKAKFTRARSEEFGLNAASRARKVSSIRGFYKYLTTKAKLLERVVYLNDATAQAINDYLIVRRDIAAVDRNALFLSSRRTRITREALHAMVKKSLLRAGLDADKYSAHKLRHTAATLMLSNGVDVRTLQELLWHENLNTTQIYTHVDNSELRIAAQANPLGKFSPEKSDK